MKQLLLLTASLVLLASCSEKTEINTSKPSKEVQNIDTSISMQNSPDKVTDIAGLSWHSNVVETFELAENEHKNVIVMVGEKSCRWCKKMKERTLIDPRVKKILENYVLVSIKRSDKEAIKFVPEFDGNIPSFFLMKPSKETIETIVGYYLADDFIEYLKEDQ
jgi:thioredoxin-related protein